jgi:hypothetical protein
VDDLPDFTDDVARGRDSNDALLKSLAFVQHLLTEYSTPEQVAGYLVNELGFTPREAGEYLHAVRDGLICRIETWVLASYIEVRERPSFRSTPTRKS